MGLGAEGLAFTNFFGAGFDWAGFRIIFSLILTFRGAAPVFPLREPAAFLAFFRLGALLDECLLAGDFLAVALAVTECRVVGRIWRAVDLMEDKCAGADLPEVDCVEVFERVFPAVFTEIVDLNRTAFLPAEAFFAFCRGAGRIAPEPFSEALECVLIGIPFGRNRSFPRRSGGVTATEKKAA